MNKVILIGRLTKDPELRRSANGDAYVQFTLAVNRNYQGPNGEKQADFISCAAWRNQAENLARYIKKGGLIAVEGSIQTGSYDDPQTGQKKFTTTVAANQISFLEAKKDNNGGYNDFNQVAPQQPSYNNYGNNSNNNGYGNNNYNNNRNNGYNNGYNNGFNQQPQPSEQKSPFADNDFEISDEDLPF